MAPDKMFQALVAGIAYTEREFRIAREAFEQGVYVGRNTPTKEIDIKEQGSLLPYAVAKDVYWRYDTPPLNAKLFLLNPGGVAIVGPWIRNTGLLGWHPMFKRDETKEGKLP